MSTINKHVITVVIDDDACTMPDPVYTDLKKGPTVTYACSCKTACERLVHYTDILRPVIS